MDPFGEANNYECVDEANPDGDTTYVYAEAEGSYTLHYDVYNMEDHTTETGTIAQVAVYAVCKKTLETDPYVPYPILKTGGSIYSSISPEDSITSASYVTFVSYWRTNPKTDIPWTWDDIDSLGIGIMCAEDSSCTGDFRCTQVYAKVFVEKDWTLDDFDNFQIGVTTTSWDKDVSDIAYFVPNGNGVYTETSKNNAIYDYYELIDDPVGDPDDRATYVYNYSYPTMSYWWERTSVTFPNHTSETGIIKYVGVITREQGYNNVSKSNVFHRIGGVDYYHPFGNIFQSNNWSYREKYWTENPATSSAWTWADIDGLESGVSIGTYSTFQAKCTQLYLKVGYDTEDLTQDVRATQLYANVNCYVDREAELINPSSIESDHANQIKIWNHWSGNRTVFSLSRQHKTLTLSGLLYDYSGYDASNEIATIMDMGKNGSTVTLSGFTCSPWENKQYKIRSFGYKLKNQKPELYEYALELEDVDKTT